jgi:DNA-binding beta-propeller fold protein YncE
MNRRTHSRPLFLLPVLLACSAGMAHAQQQEEVKGAPAEPADAAEVRRQIALVEKLEPALPDRGGALYFLAGAKQHLGETFEAVKLLKECLALREGFDPTGSPAFRAMKDSKEFQNLADSVHRDFPVVAQARVAFVTEEKDLVPEGLAYDARQNVFYLSSLNRRKIVKIVPDGKQGQVSDFVPADRLHLLPVLGIRLDPTDGSVWANSFRDLEGDTELLHFSPSGELLGRYAPKDRAKHGFNDLVVRKSGEVIVTDSLSEQVYRFDRSAQAFLPISLNRRLSYPNGIALADDDRQLFVADDLGVVRLDLLSNASADVNPGPRSTLSGVDGLYWHNGGLIAIQNGIGSPRVAAFRLSKDGLRVTQTTVLETRSPLSVLPTTGAIRGGDFYFIANSQIDNMNDDRVLDATRLERVRIAMVHLPW